MGSDVAFVDGFDDGPVEGCVVEIAEPVLLLVGVSVGGGIVTLVGPAHQRNYRVNLENIHILLIIAK